MPGPTNGELDALRLMTQALTGSAPRSAAALTVEVGTPSGTALGAAEQRVQRRVQDVLANLRRTAERESQATATAQRNLALAFEHELRGVAGSPGAGGPAARREAVGGASPGLPARPQGAMAQLAGPPVPTRYGTTPVADGGIRRPPRGRAISLAGFPQQRTGLRALGLGSRSSRSPAAGMAPVASVAGQHQPAFATGSPLPSRRGRRRGLSVRGRHPQATVVVLAAVAGLVLGLGVGVGAYLTGLLGRLLGVPTP